jgi:hypothetical protein
VRPGIILAAVWRRRAPLALALFVGLCAYAFIAPPQQSNAQSCGLGTFLSDGDCRLSITTLGAGTLTIPNDWNSASNTIEVIGGGSHLSSGNGGGGGAYSEVSNLSFSSGALVSYFVGNTGSTGGDTWFNGSGTTCASQSVCAKGVEATPVLEAKRAGALGL